MQGQGQKREQKHSTKNSVGFHNHSPLLTMVACNEIVQQFKYTDNTPFEVHHTCVAFFTKYSFVRAKQSFVRRLK